MEAWLRKPTLLPHSALRTMRFPIRGTRPWAHVTKGLAIMASLCCVALISGYIFIANQSNKKLVSLASQYATKLKNVPAVLHSNFCTPPRIRPGRGGSDGFDLMNDWDVARLARIPAQVPCFWAAYHESRLKIPAVTLCRECVLRLPRFYPPLYLRMPLPYSARPCRRHDDFFQHPPLGLVGRR